MKLLKKIRPNVFIALFAAFLLAISWMLGVGFVSASASDEPPAEITYIDTDIEEIKFAHPNDNIYLGFKLKDCDYANFGEFGCDFGGTDVYETYEKYIRLWCTYWEYFPEMNSEGASFKALYTHWNDWHVVGASVMGTLSHQTSLTRLDYGFVISIPAGTTFPSATYVHGNCEGTPIMYRTKENQAFYYDGSKFQKLSYEVAESRIDAMTELGKVDKKQYNTAERAEVVKLIEETKENVKLCLTSFALQDVMDEFYAKLDKIMTKADYVELEKRKVETKAALETFFAGLSKDAYADEDWKTIEALRGEANAMVETIKTFEEIDGAIASVKFAVNSVFTKEERAAFAAYRDAAVARVASAFNEALYRDVERAQGTTLVKAGKQAVENAETYNEVDAISADYIAQIAALKTKAQWEAEENAANNSSSEQEENSNKGGNVVVGNNSAVASTEESGCGSVMNSIGIIFGVTALAASVTIKNKVGKKDEE